MASKTTATLTGQALRSLRELSGMTLAEVAGEAGTSASYLSNVETGSARATPTYVGRVTQVLAQRLKEAA